MTTRECYLPLFEITEYFTPTADNSSEWRKARIKNRNLPYLQFMYNGNHLEPLKCMITGQHGWINVPNFVTKHDKKRFRIDFNHVRQECTETRQAGRSKDKDYYAPSAIFRDKLFVPPLQNYKLGTGVDYQRFLNIAEFLTIMPICTEYHSYISQDSAKHDITLKDFDKKTWIWALQSPDNFNKVTKLLKIVLDYDWVIDHLSNIDHDPIRERLPGFMEYRKILKSQLEKMVD